MAALRPRSDPLRLMGRRLLIAALAIIVLSMIWGVWSVWQKERESAVLKAQAQAQLASLQARQSQLESDYDTLQTQSGMEATLRAQYGMGDPGEGMIVIVEPPTQPPPAATSSVMEWLKNALSHL